MRMQNLSNIPQFTLAVPIKQNGCSIAQTKARLNAMTSRSRQATFVKELSKDLKNYEAEVFVIGPKTINKTKHKEDAGWDACDQYGCGTCKFINRTVAKWQYIATYCTITLYLIT